jgi:hypothetical protein
MPIVCLFFLSVPSLPMAITLGFLLLTFVSLWGSVVWQARTNLPAAPWVNGTRFEGSRILAMDASLAPVIAAWSDEIRAKENQRERLAVYNGNKELRKQWRAWLTQYSRFWRLNETIDKYLMQVVGWDLVGYVRQQPSREVCFYFSLKCWAVFIYLVW